MLVWLVVVVVDGRFGGQIVSMLDSGLSNLGSSPAGALCCVLEQDT